MLYSGPLIGKCFDLYGEYSESEIAVMRAFLREGSTVIEVGANIGDLTIPLAGIVGISGRVYAFESHPSNFNVLCGNLALNGITNTKPVNAFVATSDKVDTSSRWWGPDAYTGNVWKPDFLPLDSLAITACDLIKVDVDGKELDVLKSGEMQIERFRPVLYFENDTRDTSPELLSIAMHNLGYDLYWHLAPVFSKDNFFGNSVNHWVPKDILSIMILGIPAERKQSIQGLYRVVDPNDWWDRLQSGQQPA
jgi:FkbM family methyltransferase